VPHRSDFYWFYKKETSVQNAADTLEHIHYDNMGLEE
jgi:hypothetical protein